MNYKEQKKQKLPFMDRCRYVLEVLKDSDTKLGFNKICDSVREVSDTKVSKSTILKCLDYLIFTDYIIKEQKQGRGNPVEYSLSETPDIFKFDNFLESTLKLYNQEQFLSDKGAYGFEAVHHVHLENITLMLNQTLITALYEYSNSTDTKKAAERYNAFLQTQFLPCLLKLRLLAKPDMVMSKETYNIIMELYNPVGENRAKHSLQDKTPEEMSEDFLVHCKQRLQHPDTLQVWPEPDDYHDGLPKDHLKQLFDQIEESQ